MGVKRILCLREMIIVWYQVLEQAPLAMRRKASTKDTAKTGETSRQEIFRIKGEDRRMEVLTDPRPKKAITYDPGEGATARRCHRLCDALLMFRVFRLIERASQELPAITMSCATSGRTTCALVLYPTPLTGRDRSLFGPVAGPSRAEFEVGRVFQTVAPDEAVFAHDPHRRPSVRCQPTTTARRHSANIHSQPGFVH